MISGVGERVHVCGSAVEDVNYDDLRQRQLSADEVVNDHDRVTVKLLPCLSFMNPLCSFQPVASRRLFDHCVVTRSCRCSSAFLFVSLGTTADNRSGVVGSTRLLHRETGSSFDVEDRRVC